MNIQASIGLFGAIALTTAASASISTYTHDASLIEDDTNNADFDGLINEQSLLGYEEDGLRVSVERDYFAWNAPGLDGSPHFYASSGSYELVDISLSDEGNFSDFEMQVSSGWTAESIGSVYLWIQLYDNGDLIGELDLNTTSGDYVGITGGGFDQILVGSYVTEERRDEHNANGWNAVAIDNISVGTYVPVPAPGTLAISGVALIGLRRRRA